MNAPSATELLEDETLDEVDAATGSMEDTVTEEMGGVLPEDAGEIQMKPVVRIQEVRVRLEEILGGEDIY